MRNVFLIIFTLSSLSVLAQNGITKDSIVVSIGTMDVNGDKRWDFSFRNLNGNIDSVNWEIDFTKLSCTVLFYDSLGVIASQNFSDKHITSITYQLSPNDTGIFTFKPVIVWANGIQNLLSITDTFINTIPEIEKTLNPTNNDFSFFYNNKNRVPAPVYDCSNEGICTKAYFFDTSFVAGDTVKLIIGVNRASAKFKIPEIKKLRYLTHRNNHESKYVDGKASASSYVVIEYILEENLKKIKTGGFKAKLGSRTQYIKGIKLKRSKP